MFNLLLFYYLLYLISYIYFDNTSNLQLEIIQ